MKSFLNSNEEEFLQDTHEDGNYYDSELQDEIYRAFDLEIQEIHDSVKPADLSKLTKKYDKDKYKELLLKVSEKYDKEVSKIKFE